MKVVGQTVELREQPQMDRQAVRQTDKHTGPKILPLSILLTLEVMIDGMIFVIIYDRNCLK